MNKQSKKGTPSSNSATRRLVRPRRVTYQKGAVGLHHGKWSLRYREFQHFTGEWITRRVTLDHCRDRKTALQLAVPIMAEVNDCNNNGPKTPGDKLTFRQFVENYWKPYAVKKEFQFSTLDHHNSILELHLFPFFGQMLMEKVGPVHISKFLLQKSQETPRKKG